MPNVASSLHVPVNATDAVTAALAGLAYGMGDFWPADLKLSLPLELLKNADRLARGNQDPLNQPNMPRPRLRSIFNKNLTPKASRVEAYYMPLQALNMTNEALMPVSMPSHQNFDQLRAGFQASVREYWTQSAELRLQLILDAAMRFAWAVPATGFGNETDISRFSHARSVAAIASVLVKNQQEGNSSQTFTLIGGGLSQIQAFLYNITSQAAAKSLRARSFYLQLLTEAMARFVCNQLGLSVTALLYAGGGQFQILAQASAMNKLNELLSLLQVRVLQAHRGALGVNLGGVELGIGDFHNFAEAKKKMNQAMNKSYRQPFGQVDAPTLAQMIGQADMSDGDPIKFCRVTGDDVRSDVKNEDEPRSPFVESLEKLGADLRATDKLTYKFVQPTPAKKVSSWQQALLMFGLSVRVYQEDDFFQVDPTSILTCRLTPHPQNGENKSIYYPLAKFPLNQEWMTFDDYCDKSTGIKRTAVLRMDVDGLGAAFNNGFGSDASLARLNTLSFALRLFFEGWLPYLADKNPDLKSKLTIQYAGGDDLFIVGSWDAVFEFALTIVKSFNEFTAHSPALSLSGGIAIVGKKFPLYLAARIAGEAEASAKSYVNPNTKRAKNAIHVLGQTLSWDEYKQAYELAKKFVKWCANDGFLSRSLLHMFQQLYISARNEKSARTRRAESAKLQSYNDKTPIKVEFTRATWISAYQLTRVIDEIFVKERSVSAQSGNGQSNTADLRECLDKLIEIRNMHITPQSNMHITALAARWADLLLRKDDDIEAEKKK